MDLSYMPESKRLSEPEGFPAVYADYIDLLRARADVLNRKDRALMQMYLEGGYSFGRIARLAGVNEAAIARRIHKLIHRLLDSEYITCLRNRSRFSSLERTLAKDYFIEGLSQRKIAQKRDISVYQVRKSLRKIQKFVREQNNKNRIQHDTNVQSEEKLSMVGAINREGCCRNENVRGQS